MSSHIQFHHLPSLCTLGSFSKGLCLSPSSSTSSRLGGLSSSVGRRAVTAVDIAASAKGLTLCPICEAASEEASGSSHHDTEGSSRLSSTLEHRQAHAVRVAGPSQMLKHLRETHPRDLLKAYHAIQMIIGGASDPVLDLSDSHL